MSHIQKKSTPKSMKNSSLGRIYTKKRQPLTQMTYYPKSVLIDDYFLDQQVTKSQQCIGSIKKNDKIIKFVGQPQSNIKQILSSMDSLYECQNKIFMQHHRQSIQQQIGEILKIFYQKINKLRTQRECYKQMYHNEKSERATKQNEYNSLMERLDAQLLCLRKQKQCVTEKYENELKKRQFFQRQCTMLQEKIKLNNNQTVAESFDFVNRSLDNFTNSIDLNSRHQQFPFNLYSEDTEQEMAFISRLSCNNKDHLSNHSRDESNLIDTETDEETKNKISIDEKQKLQSIMKKHNLQPSQLGQIIQEYLEDLKQKYQKQFQNQEQKRLYFLAKKMETKVWNKKVQKDIQKIINTKESLNT